MMRVILFLIMIVLAGKTYCTSWSDSVKLVKTNHGRYLPHFIPIQFAGNIGLISTGIGYTGRKNRYQLSLMYGYSPASVSGIKIHTLTARNVFHFYKLHLNEKSMVLPYGALALSLELSGKSFFTLPSNMPDGYYNFPKSIHIIASTGVKLSTIKKAEVTKYFRGCDFFVELTTVDAYIWYKTISRHVKLHDILSLSFGVQLIRK